MCIIYTDNDTTMIIDLGDGKDGSVVSFSDRFAWFTYGGEVTSLPVDCIEQIIS